MTARAEKLDYPGRFATVVGVLVLAAGLLVWRLVQLNVIDRNFLQQQGDARYLRVVPIPAHRGMITDRNGQPLAISTPVESVWANPKLLIPARTQWPKLAHAVGMPLAQLARLLKTYKNRQFVYLRRQMDPALAKRIVALGIPGVALQHEYRRYYPTAEVCSQVVGFTNIDDVGQDGLELAYNHWLQGKAGAKQVIKDGFGHIVEDVASIAEPQPGHQLRLTIDRRIQYLAYRELKAEVQRAHARAGSAVVLDARTGDIIAMVNQPSYNPNNRGDLKPRLYRNRAATDAFEPGSTMKPFTIAEALDSGLYTPQSTINTGQGWLKVGDATVRDDGSYGVLDLAHIIQKSSNVGASKIALSLTPDQLYQGFTRVGFGRATGSGFPGEGSGIFNYPQHWSDIHRATLSFGYGISVTLLQLARAYAVLADGGILRTPRFILNGHEPDPGRRVMPVKTAHEVVAMLRTVIEPGGTGTRAAVPGYTVAGKTGTVHIAIPGGYAKDHYRALFAGMAPASDPRLVMAVVIDDPQGAYFGGLVAAPVFSRVMSGALRLLGVPPDDVPSSKTRLAAAEGLQ